MLGLALKCIFALVVGKYCVGLQEFVQNISNGNDYNYNCDRDVRGISFVFRLICKTIINETV